ncbi:hypothetical protein NE237_019504 [Protea cynaroides]|uniref:Uncharacterized protein n=1 Tax=Protea cynaroides TaxID=273540 RepID=A0A9Q0JT44_9MAGN|nr:hypothetical protein NE237_019504 [Protea cynaroides]
MEGTPPRASGSLEAEFTQILADFGRQLQEPNPAAQGPSNERGVEINQDALWEEFLKREQALRLATIKEGLKLWDPLQFKLEELFRERGGRLPAAIKRIEIAERLIDRRLKFIGANPSPEALREILSDLHARGRRSPFFREACNIERELSQYNRNELSVASTNSKSLSTKEMHRRSFIGFQ